MKKGVDYTGVTTVFACHDGAGNYLFSKRSINCGDEYGTWDTGGGSLEFGFTVDENLRKEIMEEYCTDVLDIEFLGYRDVHRENNGVKTHWIALDYKVLIDPAKVKNGEPHKADAIEWRALDNLPTPSHSQWPVFFKNYEARLREIGLRD